MKLKIKSLYKIEKTVEKFVKCNSPAIIAGMAAFGVIATAVSSFNAGIRATDIIVAHKLKIKEAKNKSEENKIYKETAKKLVPTMVKPVILGVTTICCTFGSLSASKRRIAALSAAYSLSETSLKDLEAKMNQVLGEKKTRELKDAVTKDKLKKDEPVNAKEVIVTGTGDVLCKDMYSGRYFYSNAEKIGQAINWASAEVRTVMYVSLNEFYDQLRIDRIPLGDDIGWNVDDLQGGSLPITYTAILTEDAKPCLCMEVMIATRDDFRRLY